MESEKEIRGAKGVWATTPVETLASESHLFPTQRVLEEAICKDAIYM